MQQLVRKRALGDIAGSNRDAKTAFDFREARAIARDDSDLRLALHERLDDAETKPAAAAGDDDALILEGLH